MPRTFTKLTLLLTIVAACGPDVEVGDATPDAAPSAPPTAATAESFVPDEAIVEVTAPLTIGEPVTLGGQRVVPISALSPGIYQVRLVDAARAVAGVDRAARTIDMIAALRASPGVRAASTNAIVELSSAPTDPVFQVQAWHYNIAGVIAAWDHVTSSSAVRLGLIDTGSTTHPDLTWGPGFDPAGGTGQDLGTYHHGTMVAGIMAARANGVGGVGVCWNCQVIPTVTRGAYSDIAAGLNWLANVDPQTGQPLGPRRADVVNMSFNQYAYGSGQSHAGQRVRCAENYESGVIGVRNALAFARGNSLLAIGAAGNGGPSYTPATDGPEFPADCPDVLSVGAVSRPDFPAAGYVRAWYSSSGPGLDLVAPGGGRNNTTNNLAFYGADIDQQPQVTPCRHLPPNVDFVYSGTAGIVSSYAVGTSGTLLGQTPGDYCYRYGSGTSFAAPHVTGTVGLLLSARPGLTPAQLESVLRLTANPEGTDLGFGDYLNCPGCGAGLVNADAAVAAVQQAAPGIATATPSSYDFGAVTVGTSTAATINMGNIGFATVQVSSGQPMTLTGPFQFASTSGCTSGQTCARTFSVPVGGAANVPIRCAPTSTGAQTGTLYIPSSSVGQLRVPLACTGVGGPRLSAPASVAFGSVVVGTTSDQAVTVTNTGSAPLTITGATVTGDTAITRASGVLPTNIAANGGTATITVRCAPTATGTFTATLALTSNGINGGAASVALSCTGIAPRLSAPASFGFGNVRVGTTSDQAVTVTNTGSAPLTITGATVTGDTAITRPSGVLPTNIAAYGGTATITVRCAPTATGTFTATLALTSNGIDGGAASVALSCTGIAPRLSAPASFGFGNVRVGTTSDQAVTVTNTGSAPLTITGATVTGDTAITRPSGVLPTNIAAYGGTATITVRCAPTATGTFTATLALTSNGIDGGAASVALSCTGVAPAIAIWPSWIEFSTVLVGSTGAQHLHITNVGTARLTITSASASGAPFTVATAASFTIAVGATAAIEVRCAPTTIGYVTGTLTVTHDAGTTPLTVGMGCVGVTGLITMLEPLGAMDLGSGESGTATIRNDGVGPLTIAELRFSSDAPRLSLSGVTLPATLAVGATLSWQVDCATWPWTTVTTKVYAKHDGLEAGSLFGVTCSGSDPGFDPPVDPVDPGVDER